jgi:hypothetical protein
MTRGLTSARCADLSSLRGNAFRCRPARRRRGSAADIDSAGFRGASSRCTQNPYMNGWPTISVPCLESGRGTANRLDASGDVATEDGGLRPAQPDLAAHGTSRPWAPSVW